MEEITAEYQADELALSEPLKVRIKTTVAAKTDLGRVRENNEDKYEFFEGEENPARGWLYLVCDGMGGHAAGQIASELASKTFIDVFLHHPSNDPEVAMQAGVQAANRYVLDNARAYPARKGMGTTLSALILRQGEAWVTQVGDSRAYRMRDRVLEPLTTDHTWIEEALKHGIVSAEEVHTHPYRHVLTRAIGSDDPFMADVFKYDLKSGDTFLLCSDGLLNHVDDASIALTMNEYSPAEASWRLVAQALQGGGTDNVTVLIVRIDAMEVVA